MPSNYRFEPLALKGLIPTSSMPAQKTVFLDRDGTINVDHGYISEVSKVELIPGASLALGNLVRAGFKLCMVTNQSGIGRGYFSEGDFLEVNEKVLELLKAEDADAEFEEIFFCPHSPDAACLCRKPKAGMVQIDFLSSQSYVVGDKESDLGLGISLDLPSRNLILVGQADEEAETILKGRAEEFSEAFVCRSIAEASEFILAGSK